MFTFLSPSDDLRSSNMLEIAASEFKVQGLEIDWSIVCWDADLRRDESNSDEKDTKRACKTKICEPFISKNVTKMLPGRTKCSPINNEKTHNYHLFENQA